jgi:drug/metabolite transporter (DMT)-like permease
MLKGVALKVAATLAFALMSALIKLASARFPVGEVVLFRSLFALALLSAFLAWRGEFPAALSTRRPLGHIGRSLAGTGGMYANFVALALLPLADATAFTFVTPLMVVPLAAILLGEAVRPYRWGAVGAGFVGVTIMLSDRLGAASDARAVGSGVALAGALFSAVAMIQTRRLTKSEATGAIVFYFSSVTASVAALSLAAAALWPSGAPGAGWIATQRFVWPDVSEAVGLAAIGLLGGAGQILMTHSYRYADASIIAAFDYVAMIWASALGYLLFSETPTPRLLIGAGVVAAAGVYVVWRVRRLGRAPAMKALTAG